MVASVFHGESDYLNYTGQESARKRHGRHVRTKGSWLSWPAQAISLASLAPGVLVLPQSSWPQYDARCNSQVNFKLTYSRLCAHLAHTCTTSVAFHLFQGTKITSFESVVPGGGVEPPRAEARRILSLAHSVSNSQKSLHFHIVTLISSCGSERFCVAPNGPNGQSLGRGAFVFRKREPHGQVALGLQWANHRPGVMILTWHSEDLESREGSRFCLVCH